MSMNDVFAKRKEFGKKLSNYCKEKKLSKTQFCQIVNISRPTLDKILNGEIQSRTTFNKYVEKILSSINCSLEEFFSNKTSKEKNELYYIMTALNESAESISEKSGISKQRIEDLQSDISTATTAELLSLAFELRVSTFDLTGQSFFTPQTCLPLAFLDSDRETTILNAAWGHMGLLLSGQKNSKWFPIGNGTESAVRYQLADNGFAFVRTLNNRVLILNMKNIKRIAFLDNDCDAYDQDWVVSDEDTAFESTALYEALDLCYDYRLEQIIQNPLVPKKIFNLISQLWGKKTYSEINALLNLITIVYNDGKVEKILPDNFSEISDYIEETFLFDNFGNKTLPLISISAGDDSADLLINPENIAYISLPLHRIHLRQNLE